MMKVSKESAALMALVTPAWLDAFNDKLGNWREDLVTTDCTMTKDRAMENWLQRRGGYLNFLMGQIKKALIDLKTAVIEADEQAILYDLTYWLCKLKRNETIDLWLTRYEGREAMKYWTKYPAPQNAEVAEFRVDCERRLAILEAQNAQRTRDRAQERAPGERWIELKQEERIYLAASRWPRTKNQSEVFEKELIQARILTERGAVVYLLPEIGPTGEKHPDAVVDGLVMEFKTITGKVRQVEQNLKTAREKAENVFLKIDSPLPRREVTRKLSGVIRAKGYTSGLLWVYFSETREINYWTVEDLG
jgi:hypothetical protein